MDKIIYYFKLALTNYAEFKGRSRRSEYWYFVLANIIISIGLAIVGGILSSITGSAAPAMLTAGISWLVSLGLLVPSLAVGVRRLHDIGKSGWFLLIAFIPIIGTIILIVWMATDGEPGSNQWGSNPKESMSGVADNLVENDLV